MPHRPSAFQMHVVVTQPLTRFGRGRVSVRPMGLEPIVFHWTPEVELDASGSEASDVAPGRYRVRAVDANREHAEVVVDVVPTYHDAVVVAEYRTTPSTSAHARDGSVEAVGPGLEQPGLHFLWTSGVRTDVPVLTDVPCGTYGVTVCGVTTVHECEPAVVTATRL
jgi:hypothetical protein